MKKKAKAGKAKTKRKRVAVKDLSAKKGGAKGGTIGLLLPAVQKVREAAVQPSGANVVMGDGSVRFISSSVSP